MTKTDNNKFIKYYEVKLGKASQQAIDLIKSKPDNENANQALARSLRIFYSFYLGVLAGNHKLTGEISKDIINRLDIVNFINNYDTLEKACKDSMINTSGDTAEEYSMEDDLYHKHTEEARQQCYRDLKGLKPLNEFD